MDLRQKRAYEEPSSADGRRVLVDRVWPRGRSREALELDSWWKELAPSNELRRWFGHEPARWDEFRERYFAELDASAEAAPLVAELRRDLAAGKRVTLVFGARDEEHNQAVALAEYLRGTESGTNSPP